MIAVQLSGGMGNQMFQYAAGRALAMRHDAELMLDSSWIEGHGGGVVTEARRYELGCFALDATLTPLERVARVGHSRFPSRRKRLSELVEPQFGQPCPALRQAPDNTYLRGYWQNTTYFADAEVLLREDFTFREASEERVPDSPLPRVSMHVRRGDYVSDSGVHSRMGTLEPDYYRRSTELIRSRVGNVQLLIVTDDPAWCERHLRPLGNATLIAATRAESARWASIMQLMASCDHHVLANSSFSWWAAWLSRNATKIVVAPRPWVLDSRWDDDHRIPHDWIRIDQRPSPGGPAAVDDDVRAGDVARRV